MADNSLSDVMPYIFGGNTNLTYEQLKRRQAVATAMASQKRPFPKTVGEGLTYLGESIGERMNENRLVAAEQDYAKRAAAAVPQIGGAPMAAPPAAAPPKVSEVPSGPAMAASAVDTDQMRVVGDAIGRYEPDPTMRDYYTRLAAREDPSGGQQVSPTGAAGPFQFTRGTAAQYGLMGDNFDNRADPDASVQAAQRLTRDNARAFMAMHGRAPTLSELALMHQQGGVTGARMVAGAGNAPARNLAVNGVDPNASPQDAASKIMAYYRMPNAQMPEGYVGDASADTPDARDAIARILANTAQGVPQANPTEAGTEASPAERAPANMVASLDPSIGVGAVAPPEAASNPPIATDIPAAMQVAQARGLASDVGAPLTPASPLPPTPSEPRVAPTPVPQGFGQPPVKPPEPALPAIHPDELKGYNLLRQFPGDPNMATLAQRLIEFGQNQRNVEYQRRVEVYKGDLARWESSQKAWEDFQRGTPEREEAMRKSVLERKQIEETLADKERAQQVQQQLGGLNPEQYMTQIIKPSTEKVAALPQATNAIARNRDLIDGDGIFSGATANLALTKARLAASAGMAVDPRIANTETFKINMAPLVASMRNALVGGAQISNADIKLAEQMAGGDITLQPETVRRVLNIAEQANVFNAVQHQKVLARFGGGDQNRIDFAYNNFGLPMVNIVPQSARTTLINAVNAANGDPARINAELQEFDQDFATPGLARQVLKLRK